MFFIGMNDILYGSMMKFNTTQQFNKEFQKFFKLKQYQSLKKDMQTLQNIICVNPQGSPRHFPTLKQKDALFVVKARLACRSLKKGTSTPLRVVYVYDKTLDCVTFLEIYHKDKQTREDTKRINAYLKELEKDT